ncbi:hypothetical protein KCP75_00675 [Salmonella enterica subsp. enterica]|nr:hypothetical protein KCP75_00675 [Salmonella enterica subsp. enterica]
MVCRPGGITAVIPERHRFDVEYQFAAEQDVKDWVYSISVNCFIRGGAARDTQMRFDEPYLSAFCLKSWDERLKNRAAYCVV